LKENTMFATNRSHARAVSVLLGGSGMCQPVARAEPELAVLLSPRTPRTSQDFAGSMSVASVDVTRQADRHD
jgi:hypothetical protein